MSRTHPTYCDHGNVVDGGDFYEPEEVSECRECLEGKLIVAKAELDRVLQVIYGLQAANDYAQEGRREAHAKIRDLHERLKMVAL